MSTREASFVAAVVAAVLLSPASAVADGAYATIGFGPYRLSDEAAEFYTNGSVFALGGGYRYKQFAGELRWEGRGDAFAAISVEGKYLVPLGAKTEGYFRAGLSRGVGEFNSTNVNGNGLGLGVGLQRKWQVLQSKPAANPSLSPQPRRKAWYFALFAEASVDFFRLQPVESFGGRSYDSKWNMLRFGAGFGRDF